MEIKKIEKKKKKLKKKKKKIIQNIYLVASVFASNGNNNDEYIYNATTNIEYLADGSEDPKNAFYNKFWRI